MKKTIIIGCLVGGMILHSCSDDLNIAPPNNITTEQTEKLLASGDTTKIKQFFQAFAGSVPERFHNGTPAGLDYRTNSAQSLNYMRSLEGNDIVYGRTQNSNFGWNEYSLSGFTAAAVDVNVPYWKQYWDNINTANKLLNYLTNEYIVSYGTKYGGDMRVLKDFRAIGLTLRAYSYNALMENYQDAYINGGSTKAGMSLYEKWDPKQTPKARASATDTYKFILDDIAEAIKLFGEAGTKITAATTDVDKGVAYYVQARAALCRGEWATVISACDNILATYNTFIPQNAYGAQWDATKTYMPGTLNAFTSISKNPEVILGWNQSSSYKLFSKLVNCFGQGPGGSGAAYGRIDNRLYEKIDDNDFRKAVFLSADWGDYTYPPNNVKSYIPAYTNIKFAAMTGETSTTDKKTVDNVSDYVVRSSEILLMKAEAQAQSTDGDGAKKTLNTLLAARTKAGATTLTCDNYSSMAGMTALQMVQLQTRIEMWGENGLEFFNNKRWNTPVDRTGSTNHLVIKSYSVADMTLQIPEDEINYNPNTTQN